MNQENIDKALTSKRDRKPSLLVSIFKSTSTVSSGDSDGDRDAVDSIMSQSPPRTKFFKFPTKYGRGKQKILESMDQNTITTNTTPDSQGLEEVDREELLEDNATTTIPVPYVDQEESLQLFSPPTLTSQKNQSNTVVNLGLRDDSLLTLELKSGPYYEIWDPRETDHFTINGRITYQPAHSPSKSASQMSHLIYLSVDTFMQCPRKPIGKGNPEPKYLKLVENSTVFEPSKKKKRSESTTITEEERHPDMKTVEENLAQPQQRQALSPIVGLLSTNSTIDIQLKPIVWFRGNQICMFRLTIPVADPFLFPDNGAGNVLRTIKVRVRGVIRVSELDGRLTVNESFVEEDIVIDILKKAVLMDK